MYGARYAVKVKNLKIVEIKEIEYSSSTIMQRLMDDYLVLDMIGLAELLRVTDRFSQLESMCKK